MYDRTHQLSHLGPQVCTVEVFLTTNSIALMDIRLVVWMSFGHLYLSRNLFISSNCRIYWHKVIHNILFFFNVHRIYSDVFSFSNIGNLCHLFSWSFCLEIYQFYCVCVCFFSREPMFLFHWFFSTVSAFYFTDFCYLYISFFLLT